MYKFQFINTINFLFILCCRDAQTVQVKQVVQQTFADRPTQMTTVGVYVSNVEDRLMTPRRYLTADKFHSNVLYCTFMKLLTMLRYVMSLRVAFEVGARINVQSRNGSCAVCSVSRRWW